MDKILPSSKRTVIIIQRVLPHYRVAFFSRLSDVLRRRGVKLRVIYGQESLGSVPRSVYPENEWGEFVENHYWSFGGIELVWQGGLRSLGSVDFVIVEQANRLLVNYLLQLYRALGCIQLAFWGHGRNFQSISTSSIRERIKTKTLKAVDWWFAYTQLSADVVSAMGYPRERITVVENSIDTDALGKAIVAVTPEQKDRIRSRLGLNGGPVGLYCGGMYPDKQLPFLIEAAEKLRAHIPNFNLLLIGSGSDQCIVEKAAAKNDWVHYVGALYGMERAVYFAVSDVMLMPGAIGLAIVDCFIAGLPMITTDTPNHGPEIAFLDNGVNGVMTQCSVDEFVVEAADVLSNEGRLEELREGCSDSATRYTLDSMVEKFSEGIMSCLGD